MKEEYVPKRLIDDPPGELRTFKLGARTYGLDGNGDFWWVVPKTMMFYGKEWAPGFYPREFLVYIGGKAYTRDEIEELIANE